MQTPNPSLVAPARTLVALALTATALAGLAACGASAAADDVRGSDGDLATVEFVGVADGDQVAGPLVVSMRAEGVTIEPAGHAHDGAGHFHIITDGGCVEPGEVIPRNATSLHFGDGSATAELYLSPGSHELCLQLGDGEHVATSLTDTVTVDVGVRTLDEWCAVAQSVDDVTDPVSVDTDELPVLQTAYTAALAYAEQLLDGLDVVDPDHRDEFEALAGLLRDFSTAVVAADDIDTLRAETDALMENASGLDAAFAHLATDCGIPVG